jgi:hypothetical protein
LTLQEKPPATCFNSSLISTSVQACKVRIGRLLHYSLQGAKWNLKVGTRLVGWYLYREPGNEIGHTMSEKMVFFLLGRSPIASPVFINIFPKKRERKGSDR